VLDEAVDLINADFARYAHYIAAASEGQLDARELDSRFVRYAKVQRYALELFDPAYDWMKTHGFTDGVNSHQSLVVS
jgi:NitT/TauT family transport system substrate-binding protein